MLQLSNIKASRISNRINLIFSDNSYLPFFIDDVVKLSLTKNQEIDSDKFDLLINTSLNYLGKEYALRQIAISPKNEKLLSQKLKLFFQKTKKKFNIPTDFSVLLIIENIISDLKSKNLLNESDFISYFIQKNHRKSHLQITFLLSKYGIKIEPSFLKKMLPKNDLLLIQNFLNKKKINPGSLANFNNRQKIIASLYRRGFNLLDIKNVIDDYFKLK
ncbi:MAG: RecX family transcriptional regulator [Candidatus Shapirobacteria bacterium]|nr:RecX family transcriptional regulator [Candidatus Shapirobacteria bacterium]